jgi:hypothetical protein
MSRPLRPRGWLGRGVKEEMTVMYYGGHMGGWGFALMVISGVVFWGLVAIGIVLLVRYIGRAGQSTPNPVTAIAAHHGR